MNTSYQFWDSQHCCRDAFLSFAYKDLGATYITLLQYVTT